MEKGILIGLIAKIPDLVLQKIQGEEFPLNLLIMVIWTALVLVVSSKGDYN